MAPDNQEGGLLGFLNELRSDSQELSAAVHVCGARTEKRLERLSRVMRLSFRHFEEAVERIDSAIRSRDRALESAVNDLRVDVHENGAELRVLTATLEASFEARH